MEIIQAKTSFTISTDFSSIVEDVIETDKLVYSDFLPKVSTVGVTEVIETSLGTDNHLSASFTTICQSGNVGAGNVALNWRRPGYLTNSTVDFGVGFGARKFLSGAVLYQIDKSTTASVQVIAGLRGGTCFPQGNYSISRVINPSLVTTAQFSHPLGSFLTSSHLSLSLSTKTSSDVKSPVTLTVSLPVESLTSASVEVNKTVTLDPKHEIRVKVGGSESGASFDIGIHRKWNKLTRASATLQIDQNAGTTLRLGITHNSLHLILPLRFSSEFSPSSIILASLLPTLSDLLVKRLIYPRFISKQKEQFWAEYKLKRAAMMERKREEAELIVQLLSQNIEKKEKELELDLEKDGSSTTTTPPTGSNNIKILEAQYRSVSNPTTLKWTVTIPLQFLCNSSDGKIRLGPSYRSNVLGFFDISPGEEKETFIRYEFNGKVHETIVLDDEELLIPQRTHLL